MITPRFRQLTCSLGVVLALCSMPSFAADNKSSAQASVPVPAYAVVKDKSTLKFIATQNNAPVEGFFKEFDAEIHFAPENLKDSYVKVTVNTRSLEVKNEEVQLNLILPEWLSVASHPRAEFLMTGITQMPDGESYIAYGDLDIKGYKTPVELNFKLKITEKNAIAEGYATLNRTDFRIGQGEWSRDDVIKHTVRVEFRVVADRKE